MESSLNHVILVSFPLQGQINPLLRLAKLIASKGLLVTFVTAEEPCGKVMRQVNKIQDGELKPVGLGFLRFEFFQGRLTDDITLKDAYTTSRQQIEAVGKREIKKLVKRYEKEEKQPVTCLINNAFVPWVCDAAEELRIPSAVLWVQSCACFASYYYYHHRSVKFPTETDTEIKRLHKSSYVFIDTFEELERDTIDHMSQLCPAIFISPIGPLFKMAKTISSDIKGDISEPAVHCMKWLDSKEPSSVVYISFGTIVHLKQEQIDEIAYGLLNSGLSCLWVVRPPVKSDNHPHVLPRELEGKGKIVEWCPQERVLSYPAVACFLSHCGWNSTMEALSSGVPVVCFPQWGDQVTNAVYLVDITKTGVRLGRGEAEEMVVSREIVAAKLVEATVGEKAAELRENARKWKEEAEAAVAYGGSSDRNFGEFVDKFVAGKVNGEHR